MPARSDEPRAVDVGVAVGVKPTSLNEEEYWKRRRFRRIRRRIDIDEEAVLRRVLIPGFGSRP